MKDHWMLKILKPRPNGRTLWLEEESMIVRKLVSFHEMRRILTFHSRINSVWHPYNGEGSTRLQLRLNNIRKSACTGCVVFVITVSGQCHIFRIHATKWLICTPCHPSALWRLAEEEVMYMFHCRDPLGVAPHRLGLCNVGYRSWRHDPLQPQHSVCDAAYDSTLFLSFTLPLASACTLHDCCLPYVFISRVQYWVWWGGGGMKENACALCFWPAVLISAL